ncbi:hypothetical protein VKT23_012839 [Stygiomarasmius scandens]|uniref:Uncharacterized protein n=1 Tax=Marasmiellus scandens TaxID=2682957 RepID=A0ABR1J4I7_9AGAR
MSHTVNEYSTLIQKKEDRNFTKKEDHGQAGAARAEVQTELDEPRAWKSYPMKRRDTTEWRRARTSG